MGVAVVAKFGFEAVGDEALPDGAPGILGGEEDDRSGRIGLLKEYGNN